MRKRLRNILTALAVSILGFVLLNLTFILDWGFQSAINLLLPRDIDKNLRGIPFRHFLFFVLILIASWFILKTKLPLILKAAYAMVPLAVVYVTLGIFLYSWPVFLYSIGIFLYIGILYCLYRGKKNWLYVYSVTFVSLILILMGILGVEI